MISIHAPAWGATAWRRNSVPNALKFQSTHPRGVRLASLVRNLAGHRISIHAPAWGATRPSDWLPHRLHNFNPRTRVGCDLTKVGDAGAALGFQSTHPRGVRRSQY